MLLESLSRDRCLESGLFIHFTFKDSVTIFFLTGGETHGKHPSPLEPQFLLLYKISKILFGLEPLTFHFIGLIHLNPNMGSDSESQSHLCWIHIQSQVII